MLEGSGGFIIGGKHLEGLNSTFPDPDAVVRSRVRRVFHAARAAQDEHRPVAQLQRAGVAEPLGRRRRL